MIKPFVYFVKENLVRKTVPNVGMARSFLSKAELRLKRAHPHSDEDSSLVFEDIYEALREASQALMEVKGYKPFSHEALISFLSEKKMLNDSELSSLDNYRVLRNNSVYRAEKVSLAKCREARDFAVALLPKIRKKFDEIME